MICRDDLNMFSQRALPTDFDFAVFETPDESFNYDEYLIRDKMLSTPMDIGSVVRFFSVVSIVVNVNTSKEVRDPKRNPHVPTFAKRVFLSVQFARATRRL